MNAPATSTADFDGDSVNDSGDACPATPRGSADANGDGCPEAPETAITSGPTQNGFALTTSASLGLGASETGSTFTCSLDDGAGAPCAPPYRLSGLSATTHLLRVWATDPASDADPTAASRTWTVPRNDTALTHSAGWTKSTGSGYYQNSFSTSTRKGAALSTRVTGVRRVALVATRGPGMGKVKVLLGSTVLRTVDLASSRLAKRQLLPVATFSSGRSGTLKIVVATSGKAVRIEGLGIATR